LWVWEIGCFLVFSILLELSCCCCCCCDYQFISLELLCTLCNRSLITVLLQFSKFRDFVVPLMTESAWYQNSTQTAASLATHHLASCCHFFFWVGRGFDEFYRVLFGIWCQKIASGLIRYNRDWKWSPKLGYGIWDWNPTMEVWSGDSWWQFLGFRILLTWLWFSICQLLNCHEIFVPTWSLVPFATIFFCFFFLCQIWLYGGNSLSDKSCV
jgi:hypothetical protein